MTGHAWAALLLPTTLPSDFAWHSWPFGMGAGMAVGLAARRISRHRTAPRPTEIAANAPEAAPGPPPIPACPDPPAQTHRPAAWPLRIDCQPTRFTVTPRQAALVYRLRLGNDGSEALGPLLVRANLTTFHAGIPHARPPEGDTSALCHYLDGLAVGGNAELTGELRMPLESIAAIRLGVAELLVPLMRVLVESAGESRPAISKSGWFAIGIPPASSGGVVAPLLLDPIFGIWRNLIAVPAE